MAICLGIWAFGLLLYTILVRISRSRFCPGEVTLRITRIAKANED